MSEGKERFYRVCPEARIPETPKEDRERFYALLNQSKAPLANGEVMTAVAILKEALECGTSSMPLYDNIEKLVANMETLLKQEQTLVKDLTILSTLSTSK